MIRSAALTRWAAECIALVVLVFAPALVVDAVRPGADAPELGPATVLHPCALVVTRDSATGRIINHYCQEA